MRVLIAIPLLLAAGCSPGNDAADSPPAAANVTAHPASVGEAALAGAVAKGMRGDDTATSESARQAKEVVQHYFDLIGAHRYTDARLLWGDGGVDSKASPAGFADSFAQYSQYQPSVGEPTAVTSRDGMQYVAVTVNVHVKAEATGKQSDLTGSVMLRRSADANEPSADKRDWRIWGTDIRVHH